MKFQNITRLLGIQTRQDSVDQQVGSLRQADGAVCWPNGALSFALPWRPAWGVTNLNAACIAALSPTHTSGTHIVILTAGSSSALVIYSFSHGVRGFFPWTGAGIEIDFAAAPVFSTPADAFAHGLNASANWFASPIGNALWIGNGVDANLYWDGTTLRLLGAAVPVAGQYARAKEKFPPCTSFVIGEQSVVYGAGNAAEPQTVWLTEQPAASEPYLEGVFSVATSRVNLLHQRGASITGLSSWSSYVVAHTTNGASVLFGFKKTNEGWLCQQRSSATGAGAVNPYCARGLNGIGTLWLGTDGELYKDDSARAGLDDKLSARDFEIATRNSADFWSRGLDLGSSAVPASLSYDSRQGMAWVCGYNTRTQNGSLWAYNEGLGQVTGPYHSPNLVRLVDCGPTRTFTLLGLTATGQLLHFRPNDLSEPASGTLSFSAPAAFASASVPPTASAPGVPFVTLNSGTGAFSLRVPSASGYQAQAIGVAAPQGDVARISYAPGNTFFNGADVAIVEFPLFDLGDVGKEKALQQVILSWAAQSSAFVGVLAQNEKGHSSWRYLGSAYGKERLVAHLNLLGVRFRLRLVVVSHPLGRAALRDVAVGYLGTGVP